MSASTKSLQLPIPHLAEQYLLDPDITFLNHGSFGACPRPVFDTYQEWQRELEFNPVGFIGRRVPNLLAEAREAMAGFVGTQAENLVFVPNATYGMNIVARSLDLEPGDEVLSSDHEYGAIDRTWRFNCRRQGARLVSQPVPLPIQDPEEVVEQIWRGVTDRTRVISLSHITSPTALIFPIEEICRRAREAGIFTVIDGAHAPGQIELDMERIGADFYTGNSHKWLSSSRGAGFLYASAERQELLDPLVVSHGWESHNPGPSQFHDYFTWVGTIDPAAYLSVPAAIRFQEENDWPAVRAACHRLAKEAEERICALSDSTPISPETMWAQLRSVPLPGERADYEDLWETYKIIVPITSHDAQTMVRISIQAYNTPEDVDCLVGALEELMGRSG